MIALGFLVRELRLSPTALKSWFAALQIGTWTNGGAGVIAAFLGASSKLMPTINEKFPPPHGTDNPLVSGTLMVCGVTILLALLLTLYGLLRAQPRANDASGSACAWANASTCTACIGVEIRRAGSRTREARVPGLVTPYDWEGGTSPSARAVQPILCVCRT